MAPLGIAYDARHLVYLCIQLVNIRIVDTVGFYQVFLYHSRERPAASMMPSITNRNTSGSSRKTNRLAMKAPDISDAPAIRPFSAISGVSAPKRRKVTDLET